MERMNALLNPNVAYVLLVFGFLLAVLAMFSPGTGLIEVGALLILAVAGFIISTLPFNWWAILLFLPALAMMWAALRLKPPRAWLALGTAFLLFFAGSAFLFDTIDGRMAVNPGLIIVLSLTVIAMVWWMASKTMEAINSRRAFDFDRVSGMTGRASSDIQGQGSVYVNGENWTATSTTFIPSGSTIRVIRRKGLMLEVEPDSSQAART
jgi:membrane-bound serine protease (ClpP class)